MTHTNKTNERGSDMDTYTSSDVDTAARTRKVQRHELAKELVRQDSLITMVEAMVKADILLSNKGV